MEWRHFGVGSSYPWAWGQKRTPCYDLTQATRKNVLQMLVRPSGPNLAVELLQSETRRHHRVQPDRLNCD